MEAKSNLDPESDTNSILEPGMEADEENEDGKSVIAALYPLSRWILEFLIGPQSMEENTPEPGYSEESSSRHSNQKATPTSVVEGAVGGVCQVVPDGGLEGCGGGGGVDGAAVLNGEELLQLLARVSPVGHGALTTVGMVRHSWCYELFNVA